MPGFKYQALDSNGQKCRGLLEAESVKHARKALRAQGLWPESVELAANASCPRAKTRLKLKALDILLLTRQLATLLHSGVPLAQSLAVLGKLKHSPNLAALALQLRSTVLDGGALAQALEPFEHAFGKMYCASVAAGEASGSLGQTLSDLAQYLSLKHERQAMLKRAAIYPVVIMTLSSIIVGFLLTYVVPKIAVVFVDSGVALPWLTRWLLATSDFLVHYYWLLIVLVVALFTGARACYAKEPVARRVQDMLLSLPLVSKVLMLVQLGNYTRTLGTLLKASVPVLEAMAVAQELITVISMRECFIKAAQKVKEGGALGAAVADNSYFGVLEQQLLLTGDAASNIEPMLLRVASDLEDDLQGTLATVSSLFEPLMTVVMGVVIMIIVLAVLLPIFAMGQMF